MMSLSLLSFLFSFVSLFMFLSLHLCLSSLFSSFILSSFLFHLFFSASVWRVLCFAVFCVVLWCVVLCGMCGVVCGVSRSKKPVCRFKTPLCVHSKRLRVCRQHVRMCVMCVELSLAPDVHQTEAANLTLFKVWERRLRTTRARLPESVALPVEICSASAIVKETMVENLGDNQLSDCSIHLSLPCRSKLHGLHVRTARSLHQGSF